jgi:hypothetical protein
MWTGVIRILGFPFSGWARSLNMDAFRPWWSESIRRLPEFVPQSSRTRLQELPRRDTAPVQKNCQSGKRRNCGFFKRGTSRKQGRVPEGVAKHAWKTPQAELEQIEFSPPRHGTHVAPKRQKEDLTTVPRKHW